MEIFAVLLIIAMALTITICVNVMARRRIEALAATAARLGLHFAPEEDEALAKRLAFLDRLDEGDNRYVHNRLSGDFAGHAVMAFDFHYETYSRGAKGGRRTQHHQLSVFTLQLPRSFPELRISPEGLLSKLAQAFGYDDIDLESAEFSRAFCVRSRDKKFAYDVCHPRMMEYLLAHRYLLIEIEGNALALVFEAPLEPTQIEARLHQVVTIRNLLPAYLFTETRP